MLKHNLMRCCTQCIGYIAWWHTEWWTVRSWHWQCSPWALTVAVAETGKAKIQECSTNPVHSHWPTVRVTIKINWTVGCHLDSCDWPHLCWVYVQSYEERTECELVHVSGQRHSERRWGGQTHIVDTERLRWVLLALPVMVSLRLITHLCPCASSPWNRGHLLSHWPPLGLGSSRLH